MLMMFLFLSFLVFILAIISIFSNDKAIVSTNNTNDLEKSNIIFSKMSSEHFDIYSPKTPEKFFELAINTDWAYGDHAIYKEYYGESYFNRNDYIILKSKSDKYESYILNLNENLCLGAYSKSQAEYGIVYEKEQIELFKKLLDIDSSLKEILQRKYNGIFKTYIYNSNDPNLSLNIVNKFHKFYYILGIKIRYILDGIYIDLLDNRDLLKNESFKNFLNKIEIMNDLTISCELDFSFDLALKNLKSINSIDINGFNKIKTFDLPFVNTINKLYLTNIEAVHLPLVNAIKDLKLYNIDTVNLLSISFFEMARISSIRYFNIPELRAIADKYLFFCSLHQENINAPKLVCDFLFDDLDEQKLKDKNKVIEIIREKEIERMRSKYR